MKEESAELSPAQLAELQLLAGMPDEEIDTSDVPEILDWSDVRRGVFYRPVKRQITLRLDADVLVWFKNRTPAGRGYQTHINSALREYVQRAQATHTETRAGS